MTETGPPPPEREPPRMFGHYELIKELGRGAQGVVHLAQDTLISRRVALKMLNEAGKDSEEVRDRFQREAEITSKLDHPGICSLYEVGEVEGVPFLAMQYIEGRALSDFLVEERDKKGLSETEAGRTISITGGEHKGEMQDVLRLIENVARALHVAHEAGLVHRDVKPHNIMVTPEGEPVLLDFGLARDLDADGQTLTQSGAVMGTPGYLAPEQIVADREHIDRRTDIYALGVTLFECLTLRRPYDAPSFDQLYHKILEAALPNPCKINRRIPKDMRTVIEAAVERESRRRYPTALAFAEDLRRVRSFEPIQAQAANVFVRVRKWARRRPGLAASIALAVILVTATTATLVYKEVSAGLERDHRIENADRLKLAGDFQGARDELAKAEAADPKSVRVVQVRVDIDKAEREASDRRVRDEALAAAAAARDESASHLEAYRAAKDRLALRRVELEEMHTKVRGHASESLRAEFARRESEIRQLVVEAEEHVVGAELSTRRAERLEAAHGGTSDATDAQFADAYMERWREAYQVGDAARVGPLRAAVERHDKAERHRAELLGRGVLEIAIEPAGAECFLFRYEDYAALRSDPVVPRLVPVPTTGIGRARAAEWHAGFHPGDPCLRITAVSPGSPAAAAGLRAGDLVIGIDGAAARGLFVEVPGTEQPMVRPLLAVNAVPVATALDLFIAPKPGAGPDLLRVAGVAEPLGGQRAEFVTYSAVELVQEPAPAAIELSCLRAGESVTLAVDVGSAAGLDVAATAYPLICSAQNRVISNGRITADYGSYLLLVRAEGHEDQRYPVVVPRLGEATARVALLSADTTPPGFAYVPGGTFLRGGDPAAFQPGEPGTVEVDGFWIERLEHTNAAYYEFLNDPEVSSRIDAAMADKQPVYVPRDTGDIMAEKRDGRWLWKVHTATRADSPVLGVSWLDVADYIAWRNERAESAGEPWVYALPSPDQWEKAARGTDGRHFPWGDRFDPCLTICSTYRKTYSLDALGGSEPRDASIYGVLDLAGSREEWTSEAVPSKGQQDAVYRKMGGCWSVGHDTLFRTGSRASASAYRAVAQVGFRLVARRR